MFLSRYFPNVTTKQKKSLLLNCHSMPKGCDSLLDSPFSNNCEKKPSTVSGRFKSYA